MECNCKWTQTVLALAILVFSLFVSVSWGKWVIVVAAALLLVHSWSCKNCCKTGTKSMPKGRKK